MRLAIEVVEEAFRQLADRKAMNVPRVRAKSPGVVLHTMCGRGRLSRPVRLQDLCNRAGRRAVPRRACTIAKQPSCWRLSKVAASGQLRTGATTAVAIEWMADVAASELGLFGTISGRKRNKLVIVARPIKQAFVYSRTEVKRKQFADHYVAASGH